MRAEETADQHNDSAICKKNPNDKWIYMRTAFPSGNESCNAPAANPHLLGKHSGKHLAGFDCRTPVGYAK